MSDFHWCCSQIKYKLQNFACVFSCIEETLKHSLNFSEGLCIKDWAAVLKDLLQSAHVEKFLVTPWSWAMAMSPSSSVGPDGSGCFWEIFLPVSVAALFADLWQGYYPPLSWQRAPGGGEGLSSVPAGTGTLLCLLGSLCSVNICGSASHLLEYRPSQESKHLLFPCVSIGLWEKGGDYCFIPGL